MITIGSATLQSDEDGMITLQCQRCNSRFKLEGDYLNNSSEKEICCPICGISGEIDYFWPDEMIEDAKDIAIAEAEEMLKNAFKGLNSKYLTVKMKPSAAHDRRLSYKNKDYDMQITSTACCNKNISLMPMDITSGYYCPYCGRIAK